MTLKESNLNTQDPKQTKDLGD